jgi:IS30 family transposase
MMNGQGQPRGTVHISGRPAEAGDRAVPGHWEGGLLFGARSSTVAALAGRKSRFVMLVRLPGSHTADAVAGAIATLPERLRRSLTWDQGKQMAEHARFSVATGVPACFCDPDSPWQRGSNENTTGCASTSPAAPASERSRKVTSTTSLLSSTTAPANARMEVTMSGTG